MHRPGGQGDATIEPAEQPSPDAWGPQVDTAWSIRVQKPGQTISGSTAARNAARALGVEKLRDTPYKTLQKLLDASEYLGQRWSRSGDKIVRR